MSYSSARICFFCTSALLHGSTELSARCLAERGWAHGHQNTICHSCNSLELPCGYTAGSKGGVASPTGPAPKRPAPRSRKRHRQKEHEKGTWLSESAEEGGRWVEWPNLQGLLSLAESPSCAAAVAAMPQIVPSCPCRVPPRRSRCAPSDGNGMKVQSQQPKSHGPKSPSSTIDQRGATT